MNQILEKLMNENEEQELTSDLRYILTDRFTMSKRQLGILLLLFGIVAFVGIFALDFIGGGREGGIGPAQRAALILMAGVAIFGASLIPLGDDPA